MRLRHERLELAFQFVFLLDSSGPSAVREAQELLSAHVEAERERTLKLMESWCSAASGQAAGTHGDSKAAVADLASKLSESLYSMVGGFLQFEADRIPQKDAKGAGGGVDISDWADQVKGAFARCVRDNLTVLGGREAMSPVFESAGDVFDEAIGVVAEAAEMAGEAMSRCAETDRVTTQLAPTWPPHRQAATDRAILRLGRSEMLGGRTPPKWVIHHCVNLAKWYSTEKSPPFVNALLDKILKQVQASAPGAVQAETESETPAASEETQEPSANSGDEPSCGV